MPPGCVESRFAPDRCSVVSEIESVARRTTVTFWAQVEGLYAITDIINARTVVKMIRLPDMENGKNKSKRPPRRAALDGKV